MSEKSLDISDQKECRENITDVVIFGEDLFVLLAKASSKEQGWMKSTKAMQIKGGCVVQVTTQQRNPDESYVVAEAVTFVPGVKIVSSVDKDGKIIGRKLL